MKSLFLWLGGLTAALLLLYAGCRNPTGANSFTEIGGTVTFIDLEANGSETEMTTTLTLTFNRDIKNFESGDIIIESGFTGAIGGSLSKTETGVYELTIGGLCESGEISVSLKKTGFTFLGGTKTVDIFFYVDPDDIWVEFLDLQADGSSTSTTSTLTLWFDMDIEDFSERNIFIRPVAESPELPNETPGENTGPNNNLTVGPVVRVGTGVYEAAISGIDSAGEVEVAVAKPGYIVIGGSKKVEVKYVEPVEFLALLPNGSPTLTTTKLSIVLEKDIGDLSIDNIVSFISGDTGAVIAAEGNLTHEEESCEYELEIAGVTESGELSIDVSKPGFDIYGGPLTAALFYAKNVTFSSLGANGSIDVTTTALSLRFSEEIPDLSAEDIVLTDNGTGAVKGELSSLGDRRYELVVSGVTASGTVTAALNKPGYTIVSRNTYVYAPPVDVAFTNLDQDGSATEISKKLILSFDRDIAGLEINDITISAGETGLTGGALSKPDGTTGKYELSISSIKAGGEIMVAVTKPGFVISPPNRTTRVYYPVKFTDLGADGSDYTTTGKITLVFDKEISGLARNDITIDAGSTGASRGILTNPSVGVYELTLTGIIRSGQITVNVSKTGYDISGGPKTANIKFADAVSFNSLGANNTSNGSTIGLTLNFSKTISGLAETDIILNANSTGAKIDTGTLSYSGSNSYTLGISGVSQAGTVSVNVQKAGFAITGGPKTADVQPYVEDVSFNSVTADGSPTSTTTKLTLNFDKDIPWLTAANISLSGISATKGGLTKPTGTTGRYELTVSGITASGQVSVTINIPGGVNNYRIIPNNRSTQVYLYIPPTPAVFNSLNADGTDYSTSTRLYLVFDKDISGLASGDIILDSGSTGAVKGTLTHPSVGHYELTLNSITGSGQITVTVIKTGYVISGGPKAADIKYAEPVSFSGLTTNKTSNGSTTGLTLSFNKYIPGLTEDDITLDANSTGAKIISETLSYTGSNNYTIGINSISLAGNVSVDVKKTGYNITGGPRTTAVQPYVEDVSFNSAAADGSLTSTTTKITLLFDKDIAGLTAANINLSGTSVTKGALTHLGGTPGGYELAVSNVAASGQVTVTISVPAGYNISPLSRNTQVYRYVPPTPVTLTNAKADGSEYSTTTKITINFNIDISGLAAGDIILSSGSTGASGIALTKSAGTTGQYELTLGGIVRSGEISVNAAKSGYIITGGPKTADIKYAEAVTFSGLTTNSTSNGSTTGLTLSFSKEIPGLAEADINLDANSTGAAIISGTLSYAGSNKYTLGITGVAQAGSVSVNVQKAGYNITGGPRTTPVQPYVDDVSFISLAADGSATATTTKLTIYLNKDVEGLTAANIALSSGSTGAIKGALTHLGGTPGRYELGLSGITGSGQVTVTVTVPAGFNISPDTQSAQVYHYIPPIDVAFNSLSADGSDYSTSTGLSLVFDKDISGLAASDIMLDSGSTGAVKGTLTHPSTGNYELTLNSITGSGQVAVTVAKAGYSISGGPKTTNVKYAEPVTFSGLTTNKTSNGSTTGLTLSFNKYIPGLAEADITLTPNSTGAKIISGTLSYTGSNNYTIGINSISLAGNVSLDVKKIGYNITGGPRTTAVQPYVEDVSFNSVASDGSLTLTTTKLTLYFDKDIAGLTAANISLSPGTTGATKGALTKPSGPAGRYELGLSGITASGQVTVTVTAPAGYNISPGAQSTQIYHYIPPIEVAFSSLTADGTDYTTTGQITLGFDKNISGLAVGDIILSSGSTGAEKGTLTNPSTGSYVLTLNNITGSGQVSVNVTKSGYTITGGPKTTDLKYAEAVTFSGLTTNSTSNGSTTGLSLSFSKEIPGLAEADITLTPNSTEAKIITGTLSYTGSNNYTLGISGITQAGNVSVNVQKAGYNITGGPRTTPVQPYVEDVSFNSVAADGSATSTTTKLTLLFDKDIPWLTAANITLSSGSTGAVKGALSKPAGTTGRYELTVSGITGSGQITVTIGLPGEVTNYRIIPDNRNTFIYHYVPPVYVTFNSLAADGSPTQTSTKLTLTFDKDIAGLSADDLTLSSGETGAVKGALTKPGGTTGRYELGLSGITATGQVMVSAVKDNHIFTPPSLNTTVYLEPIQAPFNSLNANGSPRETTTKLTLSFGIVIPELSAADITFTPGGLATKGTLTQTATPGVYDLTVSNISTNGTLTVSVSKENHAFTPASRPVSVFYAAPVSFTALTADGTLYTTTEYLSLTFDKDITGLSAGDITLSGSTGATKGSLNKISSGNYELQLNDISGSGMATVAVGKDNYNITPGSKDVFVSYAVPVVFSGLSANGGERVQTTDTLTLTFNKDIVDLNANDITLTAGSTGAQKGLLTKRGGTTGVYDLALSGIVQSGTVNVTQVRKPGYSITGNPPNVTVYVAHPVSFEALSQNGSNTKTTTMLSLAFDRAINDSHMGNLSASDITITAGSTGAVKGILTGSGPSYNLTLNGVASNGSVTVNVGKNGYAITPGSRSTNVFYAEPVSFTGLGADGSYQTETTTKLILNFNKDITGLSAADIEFTPGSTGAVKGALTKTGTGEYELALSGISAAGQVTVNVSKSGYDISGGPKNVSIYINTVSFTNLNQDGSLTKTTKMLTFNFSKDIADLNANDVTLSAGSTGAVKGALTRTGTGVYTLALNGITEYGVISVTVEKADYVITPASRTTEVFYAIPVNFTGLIANDTATEPASLLTLSFDRDITGLTADNITLSGSTNIIPTKGILTKVSNTTGVYELAFSVSVNSSSQTTATITAAVSKPGYEMSGTRQVSIRVPRSFTALTANGSATQTTSQLNLTFDRAIPGLAAGDITIGANSTGAVKGALSGSGPSYTLGVSGITVGGEILVTVNKTGFSISSASRNVNVFYAIPVTFSGLGADGSGTVTTTKLSFNFSSDIFDLSASDITLTPGSTGAQKGSLNKTGAGQYELMLTGISSGGSVTAAVSKNGYQISPANRSVTVNYAAPRTFTGLTANGNSGQTTTQLNLTFNSAISGLAASDIILNAGTTGAVKGALTGSGPSYTLAVTGITRSGMVEVNASKNGFAISGGPHQVQVYAVVNAPITIGFDQIADAAPVLMGPTLYRVSNNGPTTETITLGNPGQYESIVWRVQGTDITGTGASFMLDAANSAYNYIGEHFLTVDVRKNGAPYNKTISFIIEY